MLNAGQGEFTRFCVSPGDAEEAYYWAQIALNFSWKYQIPSIVLTDKTLGEGTYSFDKEAVKDVMEVPPELWDRQGEYKRYVITATGLSPFAFPPDKDAIIKANSYEHDEFGITTESPELTRQMQDKRLKKERYLADEIARYEPVRVYGNERSSRALLCWGSTKGVCVEVARTLGVKVIQPVVLAPFPFKQFKMAMKGVERLISVECNATGQLVKLINRYGLDADEMILKYDGRPFSVEELESKVREVLK